MECNEQCKYFDLNSGCIFAYMGSGNPKDAPCYTELEKGKWIKSKRYYESDNFEWEKVKCSICEKYIIKPIYYHNNKYSYCPCCGAKME